MSSNKSNSQFVVLKRSFSISFAISASSMTRDRAAFDSDVMSTGLELEIEEEKEG